MLVDMSAHPGVYLYMYFGSVTVFTTFGAYAGFQEDRLRQLALEDELTGLYNRRHFHRQLERELKSAQRHGRRLSLLVADLDYFKRINDCYGHSLGDQLLAKVGRAITQALRPDDTAYRIGGEEFAVILPGADSAASCKIAERVRASVRDCVLRAGTDRVGITLSVGTATFNGQPGGTTDTLFNTADIALYRAKALGRDRVEPGDLPPATTPEPAASVNGTEPASGKAAQPLPSQAV